MNAAEASGATIPVALHVEPAVRDTITHRIAVRKRVGGRKPRSVVGIAAIAIRDLARRMNAGGNVGFTPVPSIGSVRFVLRLDAPSYALARKITRAVSIRLTDFVRTAVMFYLRKHESEIVRYMASRKRG